MIPWFARFEISKIIDFRNVGYGAIFLGNIYQARKLAYNGNPLGITAVLDVSTENDYNKNPYILYLRVPFNDNYEIPKNEFSKCMDFLSFCWKNNMTILVNCAAGISRSPSIVVSFLYYEGIGKDGFTPPLDDMDKILDYVKSVRSIVDPDPRVLNSCKRWLRVPPYDGDASPSKHVLDNMVDMNVDPKL